MVLGYSAIDMNELGNTPADKNYKPSGISKAEQKAWERYPNNAGKYKTEFGTFSFGDTLFEHREGFIVGYEQAAKDTVERAIAWLKEHANEYIVDLTPTYPDAPVKIIVGGMCWEHLKTFLENE